MLDGKDFVAPLQNAGRDAGRVMLQATGEVSDQSLGLVGIIQFPRLPQSLADTGMKGLGKTIRDVAGLVDLATLDRGMAAEGIADRFGQRLGTIDDEQAADCRVEPTGSR